MDLENITLSEVYVPWELLSGMPSFGDQHFAQIYEAWYHAFLYGSVVSGVCKLCFTLRLGNPEDMRLCLFPVGSQVDQALLI